MKELSGNLSGLASGQTKKIQKLYDSKPDPGSLISQPALERLVSLSHEIRRQIGVLINRDGRSSSNVSRSLKLRPISKKKIPGNFLEKFPGTHSQFKNLIIVPHRNS